MTNFDPDRHPDVRVHESAYVDEPCEIGAGTSIWHFSHVMAGEVIGRRCNLGQNVFVSPGVTLGDNVKVQNNVSIYTGVVIEDDVFCGPSMVFTNVVNPRSEIVRRSEYRPTVVRRGATLGTNCTIVCGVEIGTRAFIGAGAVVTGDVPAYTLMLGVPARRIGWMCRCGERLGADAGVDGTISCGICGNVYRDRGTAIEPCRETQQEKHEEAPAMSDEITVPLLDLKAQYAGIRTEVAAAMDEVVESQWFIMGPVVKALEDEIAAYCRTPYAVSCASGSDALLLALMALGVGPGDEVICPSYTFFATGGSIHRLGARPVFADIDPATYNLDPASVRESARGLTRLKAIMPVHLFGQAADMDAYLDLGRELGVPIIEDAAQAIGTQDDGGHRAGSRGAIGCFSFFPSKNLGAFGDGGICTTNDEALADSLGILRLHGGKPKYYHRVVGVNSRLDALHAAVLRVKLGHLDAWTAGRQANAQWYDAAFAEAGAATSAVPLDEGGFPLRTPSAPSAPEARHIYNQYVIRVPRAVRDGLREELKSRRVGTEIYYPVPLHLQDCFRDLGYAEGDLPHTERAAHETIALPIYPELTEAQKQHVATSVLEYVGKQVPAGSA